jgi:hypothetical protein
MLLPPCKLFACPQNYAWRNDLQFSPTAKKNGVSYVDVVLRPMAAAVNRAIKWVCQRQQQQHRGVAALVLRGNAHACSMAMAQQRCRAGRLCWQQRAGQQRQQWQE